MEVKEAVQIAKQHIADVFEGEGIADVGLEEAVRAGPHGESEWKITISFTRPWNRRGNLAAIMRDQGTLRAHKTVVISDSDGAVLSLTEGERPRVA